MHERCAEADGAVLSLAGPDATGGFRNLTNIPEGPFDASGIGDSGVFHWDVQVSANKHPLAGDVRIVECPEHG
jgi:hypothetical protein